MKALGIVVLLCGVALCAGFGDDQIGFPGEPPIINNRPERPGRPTTTTTTTPTPGPTPSNPGVDGAGALIGCNCPSTSETNVVCGSDGNTYGNMGKLRCAQRCGHDVEFLFIGNCRPRG